jgi:hypothetical protein
VSESLDSQTDLGGLLQDAESVVFSRQDEARSLDLEYFEETELFETIPHVCPVASDSTGRFENV